MRAKLLFAFGVLILVLGMSGLSTSALAQGNSESAKQCQKGGWQELDRSDQTPFANQGECVSYTAQGGTFWTPPALLPIFAEEISAQAEEQDFAVHIKVSDLNIPFLETVHIVIQLFSGESLVDRLDSLPPQDGSGTLDVMIFSDVFTCSSGVDHLVIQVLDTDEHQTLLTQTATVPVCQ